MKSFLTLVPPTGNHILAIVVVILLAFIGMMDRACAQNPRTLEEALLNYTWEWTHAPKPPDQLVFGADGVARCPRFSWHWKITGPRTARAFDAVSEGKELPNFTANLTFDAAFTTLKAHTPDKKFYYTGRRLEQLAKVAPPSRNVGAVTQNPITLEEALESFKWSWSNPKAAKGSWTEVQFMGDGTMIATAGVGEYPQKTTWRKLGPATIEVDGNKTLKFEEAFTSFTGKSPLTSEITGVRGQPVAVVAKAITSASPAIQTDANQPRIEVLKDQAPNAIEWALAPLEQAVPGDIRQNLTFLREDLLDEGKQQPKASADAYTLAAQICQTVLAALEERNQTLVRAGFRAVEAQARTGVSSQALEARRNYKMSWPQFAREESQRAELKSQAIAGAAVMAERPKLEWSQRTAALRQTLDELYRQFREALRQTPAAK